MYREIHNLDEVKVTCVNNFIYWVQNPDLSGYHACGLMLQTLLLITWGCLVCAECIDNKTTSCPIYQKLFDIDDFQRLQPGLDLQWSLNLQEEKEEHKK